MTHAWPLFDLVVRSPRMELRLPTDAELVALGELARDGVHAPDEMPFCVAWTRHTAPEEMVRGMLKHHWGLRSRFQADSWRLAFAAFVDGEVVGTIDVGARHFALLRGVNTGSWIGMRHQRKGYGTEMRSLVLELAFRGLGAERAESSYLDGNYASAKVSAKLGYEANGLGVIEVEGQRRIDNRVLLTRTAWTPREDVEIHGLDACLPLFGLDAVAAPAS